MPAKRSVERASSPKVARTSGFPPTRCALAGMTVWEEVLYILALSAQVGVGYSTSHEASSNG
jgi:hypothetical protein